MNVGIVGNEAAKFTPVTEAAARAVIRGLLAPAGTTLVSGHCHLGGIDIWAEEIARELGRAMIIHPPKHRRWDNGYRPRNIAIATDSAAVVTISVAEYPPAYRGKMRFTGCYHCQDRLPAHVKSGGCWTAWYACRKLAKPATLGVIRADGTHTMYPLLLKD